MPGPLYRQIAEDLRRQIDEGQLAESEQLPTEDQLIESYHASRNTVRAAIKDLTTRGIVQTRHGIGTFVIEQLRPIVTTLTTDPETGSGGGEGLVYTAEVEKSGRIPATGGLRLEIQPARPEVADSLRIPVNADVISRHQRRYVDETPWSLQTSFYPMQLAEKAPRLLNAVNIDEGTVAYLRECGIQQAGYRDSIEVRTPQPEEISFFQLPVDGHIQVVEIFRVAFDQKQRRVRLTITVYRADSNRFVINVGDVPLSENLQVDDD
jgi:GntR family transcriptional regulator